MSRAASIPTVVTAVNPRGWVATIDGRPHVVRINETGVLAVRRSVQVDGTTVKVPASSGAQGRPRSRSDRWAPRSPSGASRWASFAISAGRCAASDSPTPWHGSCRTCRSPGRATGPGSRRSSVARATTGASGARPRVSRAAGQSQTRMTRGVPPRRPGSPTRIPSSKLRCPGPSPGSAFSGGPSAAVTSSDSPVGSGRRTCRRSRPTWPAAD